MPRYNPAVVEPKWQRYWEEQRTFAAPRLPDSAAGKMYVLDMFPYPSGDGLHVGHPEGYTATDIVSRYQRMRGKCVMHPMGFDSFGLPAEEHAIRTNTPPRQSTEQNIANFRRQLKMLGFSYDWDRELATTDPGYFKWTQFIFLVLFDTWFDVAKQRGRPISELPIPSEVRSAGDEAIRRYQDSHRLAYQHEAPVNWCPALGTVLANEEVIGGVSEVGGHPVVRLPLRQWMLRITAYADRLENDLELVNWPSSIKKLQSDWIGRSTGAEVDFYIGEPSSLRIVESPAREMPAFRPSPATTCCASTPRAPTRCSAPPTWSSRRSIRLSRSSPRRGRSRRCKNTSSKPPAKAIWIARSCRKPKPACSPAPTPSIRSTAKQIPIWIADYVLISYGTGAIMAVPAHDQRDFEFAKAFKLPIRQVVADLQHADTATQPPLDQALAADGVAINSGPYNRLSTPEFKLRITADLAAAGLGIGAVNYKLRDWLFSRQRFWGEPFPILHELDAAGKPTGLLRTVPVEQLPVDLPKLADYKPPGEPKPPLEKAPAEWLYPVIDGKKYKRETNTMPQWAGLVLVLSALPG